MLLVDDLAAGGTKNLRHTPRGLVTLNELNLILIWSSRILWFILDQCMLSEHTKRTDSVQQK